MRSVVLVVFVSAVVAIGRPADPVRDAQTLINQGHPWRATLTLAPTVANPRTASRLAVLTAARAAAGWGGWSEIDRLLGKQSWVDSAYGGEGRELLARSALAAGDDQRALSEASAAFVDGKNSATRNVRTVLLARALERNNMFDSAAVLYARAGDAYPIIRDWLLLRAAGSESDSALRRREYVKLASNVAKSRRLSTEAQARERFSDAIGSAQLYAQLGATVSAIRLRLSVAPDTVTRDSLQRALLSYMDAHRGTADARAAVDVLDKAFTSLSPRAELIVGRAIATNGTAARAVTAFQHAFSDSSSVSPADRMLYATALSRAGRARDAMTQLESVEGPLAGQARYQRARILLTSGTGDALRAALRDIVARYANDTAAASSALYLLADLTTDDGNDAEAASLYRRLYSSYPTSPRAASARFNASLLTLVSGNAAAATAGLDSLVALMPQSDDANAARYWAGRSREALKDANGARAAWHALVSQQPTSYYGVLAAHRLDEAAWVPPARADSYPTLRDVDSTMLRINFLDRLGMDAESRLESDALEAGATTTDRMLAVAHAFATHAQPTRAMHLAQKIADAGLRDARTFRLLYPLVDRDELTRDASSHDLDPALVAGLIRQESGFNPRAVSVANARGLMQLLPSVGEELSHSLNFPLWNQVLLFDADANLQLGTAHLTSFVKQYASIPRVLAAYNAGGSRVTRWETRAGTEDPEMFAERIPFAETRDYVRIVQRNAAMYRALYSW